MATPSARRWRSTLQRTRGDFVETTRLADPLGRVLDRILSPLRGMPSLRSLLSGTGLGHALHPALVTAPIGAWTGATILDLTRRDPATARSLVGAGVLMALPSALSGASDWLDVNGSERQVDPRTRPSTCLPSAAMGPRGCCGPSIGCWES